MRTLITSIARDSVSRYFTDSFLRKSGVQKHSGPAAGDCRARSGSNVGYLTTVARNCAIRFSITCAHAIWSRWKPKYESWTFLNSGFFALVSA
jgi:hypothetical protein